MTLREFRSMLLGANINVFADHRNLTFANFNTQCDLRWRCYVEEYAPRLFYLRGKLNVLADAFTRLPRFDSLASIEGKSDMDNMPLQDPTSVMGFYTNIEEATLYDCLKYLPKTDEYYDTTHSLLNPISTDDNPLSYVWLKDAQDEDPRLNELCNGPIPGFHKKYFCW